MSGACKPPTLTSSNPHPPPLISDAEKGELTDEELSSYIERVMLHPGNWLVFSTCLLLQTRVESRRSKTAGRSVFQLEVLIAEYTTAQAGALERSRWLHALPWPVQDPTPNINTAVVF